MNKKSNLKSVTSFLAICASVVSACICVLLIYGDYHTAHYKMDTYNREFQGWEACRQTNPAYFKANDQAVNTCVNNLNEARANFWVKIPKTQWAGILILAGLASATMGYFATWLFIWLAGLVIYKLMRLITSPFKHRAKKQVSKKRKLQAYPARA